MNDDIMRSGSSLESSDEFGMSNRVVLIREAKQLITMGEDYNGKDPKLLSRGDLKQLLTEYRVYDDAEHIQFFSAEITQKTRKLLEIKNTNSKEIIEDLQQYATKIRGAAQKILENLAAFESQAIQLMAERQYQLQKKMIQCQDQNVLFKEKIELMKTKYKIRKFEMKKEIRTYKEHLSQEKILCNKRIALLEQENETRQKEKDRILQLYFDRMQYMETELNALISALNKEGMTQDRVSFGGVQSPAISKDYSPTISELIRIKNNVKEFQNPRQFNCILKDATDPLNQSSLEHISTSLNKAFVRSGILGLSHNRSEKGISGVSRYSGSQKRCMSPLSETQMKHYFGSNYNLLSVTQREKILYSILNKSEHSDTGADVKFEDVMNVSKHYSSEVQPISIMHPHLESRGEIKSPSKKRIGLCIEESPSCFPKEIFPIPSLIEEGHSEMPPRVLVDNKGEDTLEISFKERFLEKDQARDAGDSFKDIFQINKI